MNHKVTGIIRPDQAKYIHELKKREGVTLTAIIQRAIDLFIANTKKPTKAGRG